MPAETARIRDAVYREPSAAPLVLVFDSGVGGLSVLAEIRRLLPGLRLGYCADNAAFPYGGKSETELVRRVTAVIARLVETARPDLVVIACNTASTSALDAVRGVVPVPVVGVVPAIKPAAQISRTRSIGLLGTASTVASPYTRALIGQFAGDCAVVACGAPELVAAAEAKLRGEAPDPSIFETVLRRMFSAPGGGEIDTVVLGCTHFPLLRDELARTAGRPITWLDSGAAIARRVGAILGVSEESPPVGAEHRPCALFTGRTGQVEQMRGALAQFGIEELDYLPD